MPGRSKSSAEGGQGPWGAHLGSGSGKDGAQGVRRRGPAAELVSVLADRPMWGLSGSLDPLDHHVESLQRCYGGQETQSGPGGVEILGDRLTGGEGSSQNSGAGRGATSELRLLGVPRGLGGATARLAVDRGVAGRRGRGGAGALRGEARRGGRS